MSYYYSFSRCSFSISNISNSFNCNILYLYFTHVQCNIFFCLLSPFFCFVFSPCLLPRRSGSLLIIYLPSCFSHFPSPSYPFLHLFPSLVPFGLEIINFIKIKHTKSCKSCDESIRRRCAKIIKKKDKAIALTN